MKIYDKHSHKLMMIVFGSQIFLGVSGLIKNHPDFFSYFLILLSLLGIGFTLYKKKFPYVEIENGEVIMYGLIKKKLKLNEIISMEKIDNILYLKSSDSKLKIRRTMLDTLEVRKFEDFIKNEISGREFQEGGSHQ
ncbi:hypothetical protein MM236_03250 [Belliella sp. DSM 107340]|uniref:PH domain-containing protein n=1 Tax=Belliella calami TaxID=2923436 RepID=A0ABS9UKT6_9BACT|nr:hypothetical protein [Belliella calami]MCH7396984.1 hypothetical protein [Belliella calami]